MTTSSKRAVPLGRLEEPGDHLQEGGLAAARGADDHHELTGADRQVDPFEGADPTPATVVAQREVAQLHPGAVGHEGRVRGHEPAASLAKVALTDSTYQLSGWTVSISPSVLLNSAAANRFLARPPPR